MQHAPLGRCETDLGDVERVVEDGTRSTSTPTGRPVVTAMSATESAWAMLNESVGAVRERRLAEAVAAKAKALRGLSQIAREHAPQNGVRDDEAVAVHAPPKP